MIKKLFLLLLAVLALSCGSSKSASSRTVVRKTTPTTRKPVARKPAAKPTYRKPIVKKADEKTQNSVAGNQGNSGTAPKSETLEAVTRVKVTTEMVLAYINLYKGTAKSNMSQYGIPSSIILAQGILESGAGTGPLSAMANNHFGIKCHNDWTGESVRYDDDSEQECFRKYNQPSESYRDHALFLTTRSRYAGLFKLDKGDYAAWAKGLRAAGYATDPKYPEKLIGLIQRYQLDKYDAEVLGNDYVPVTAAPTIASTPIATAAGDSASGYYQVNQGDTLYSISKKFSLTVDELKRINNMSDNAISIGQNLKVK